MLLQRLIDRTQPDEAAEPEFSSSRPVRWQLALTASGDLASAELTDLAGDNDHWSIVVTSPSFAGKTRVAQHRMVTDALGSDMGTTLHALSVTTKIA